MNFRNTNRSWGVFSKTLHWVIVLLIIYQWYLGMHALSLGNSPAKISVFALHKSIGMTVFMLAIVRLVWRWANPVPSLDGVTKGWERLAAGFSHVALYGLIFLMPITGLLMSSARNFPVSWFGLFQWPDFVQPDEELFKQFQWLHRHLFQALVCIAVLHILGALKHHFIDRNDVLKRMLPFGGVK
jgi:cytochrome b561